MTTTALVPLADMDRMAAAIAASGLFGMKRKEEALALMIVAQAEQRHPGSVAAEYHIIQGRPALRADAMLARFQQAGGAVKWLAYTDEAVSAEFSHPQGGTVMIDWSMERAKKAGLTGKDNWHKYPRQMLRARVVSEGVRTCFPAVCVGVYTPEEVQDMPPEREVNPRPRRYGKMPQAPVQTYDERATVDQAMRDLDTERAAGGSAEALPSSPLAQSAGSPLSPGPDAAASAPAPTISADQHIYLCDCLRDAGITQERACKAWKVQTVQSLPESAYDRALDWIHRAAARNATT